VRRPLLVAVRALGLGDLLTAVPALRALAGAFPGHRRVLAAPAPLAPIAALSGAVDEVVDTRWLHTVSPLDPALSGADVAVNLHGRGPQSTAAVAATRPGRLVAFAGPGVPGGPGGPGGPGRPAWRPGEHEVARWCRLLAESGIPADPTDLDLPVPPVAPPPEAVGATVVHPGAASPARRWPAARFAAVAAAEAAAGRPVVVTGSAAEVPLAREVAASAGLPPECVLAGRTDLVGLVAVVAAAGRVVCGDTGVAHLATALARPSVVLFGPTPPGEWGPPPDRPVHRTLWAGQPGDPHGAEPDPGLLAIGVDEVLEALAGLERVGRAP
jgi:ADP-heptose:LPS heptosyltransferase